MPVDPTVRALAQLDRPHSPRPEFAAGLLERLLQDLDTEDAHDVRPKEDTMSGSFTIAQSPVHGSTARPARLARFPEISRSLTALAATILLVLFTGGIGMFAFQERYWTRSGDDLPGVENELLVATMEETLRPAMGGHWVGIERVTMAPGTLERIGDLENYDYGVYLFLLESGQLAFSATGNAGVIAAGSDLDEVSELASDTPALMVPGDRGVIHSDAEAVWRSVGSEPAVILVASISTGATGNPVPGSDWETLVSSASLAWPASPVTFEFRRITIDAGSEIPLSQLPALSTTLIFVESGAIDAPLGTDDAPRTREFDTGEELVPAVWPLRAGGAIRNNGEAPAVLYVMTMTGGDPSGTPTS